MSRNRTTEGTQKPRGTSNINLPRSTNMAGGAESGVRTSPPMRRTLSLLALVALTFAGLSGLAVAQETGASAGSAAAVEATPEKSPEAVEPTPSKAPEPTRENLPDDCRDRAEEFKSILHKEQERMHADERAFREAFDAAREEMSKREATQEERQAFHEKWYEAAKLRHEEHRKALAAAMESAGLGRCFERFYSDKPEPLPPEPVKPVPASQAHPMDEGARKIMERCEAKARALWSSWDKSHRDPAPAQPREAYPAEYPQKPAAYHEGTPAPRADGASTSYEGPIADESQVRGEPTQAAPYETRPDGAHSMSEYKESPEHREMKAKMEALHRACEKELREYFQNQNSDERFGSCSMFSKEDGLIHVECKHIRLLGIPEEQTMTQIHVRDTLYVDRLYAKGFLATFEPQQTKEGSAIQVFDASKHRVLSIHDSPKGIINLAASDDVAAFVLDLADNLKVERYEEGLRFSDGKHRGAIVLHGGSLEVSDGNVVLVTGKATFFVGEPSQEDAKLGEAYPEAIAKKRVGAEIALAKGGKTDTVTIGDGFDVRDLVIEGAKFTAKVDSEDGKCKTVVFKLESGLLGNALKDLDVKVTDVSTEGGATAMQVQMASDLEDVLDPCDDGAEMVEYWSVSDANGLQVLVSIPHFSEKHIEVSSAGAGSLVPGFETPFLIAGLGLVMIVASRRRRA